MIPSEVSCSINLVHSGSTFSATKPFSESKPMWETCLKEEGVEMLNLSMKPRFFFLPGDDEAALRDASVFLAVSVLKQMRRS